MLVKTNFLIYHCFLLTLIIWLLSFLSIDYIARENSSSVSHEISSFGQIALAKLKLKTFGNLSSTSTLVEFQYSDERNPCCSSLTANFSGKCEIYSFMKYWSGGFDCYSSPLKDRRRIKRYVVFEPDLGGWNNIRMALEIVILFAHTTGRILVLPPNAVLYLLARNSRWGENKSSLSEYYDLLSLMKGIEMMPMNQFLTDVALPGYLKYPLPNNDTTLVRKPLWDYLSTACFSRDWSVGKYFFGFNILGDSDGATKVRFGKINESLPSSSRLRKISLNRTLITYDRDMHEQKAIFFSGRDSNRLLTHFYAFLYWEDQWLDRFYKRYVRDRLRYRNDIFCEATRVLRCIIEDLQEIGVHVNHTMISVNGEGVAEEEATDHPVQHDPLPIVSYHIRRGEFQQKQTRIAASDILRNTLPLIGVPASRSSFVYIASDETNSTFFEPFFNQFKHVRFLSDYTERAGLSKINQNHLGMIEQVGHCNSYRECRHRGCPAYLLTLLRICSYLLLYSQILNIRLSVRIRTRSSALRSPLLQPISPDSEGTPIGPTDSGTPALSILCLDSLGNCTLILISINPSG